MREVSIIVLYIVIGLIQFSAVWAGISLAFGFSGLGGFLLSMFLGWFPLIGSILGIWGAIYAWEWPWYLAIFLFFGSNILLMLIFRFISK